MALPLPLPSAMCNKDFKRRLFTYF